MGRHLCNPSMARCRCPMLPFCLDLVARSKQKFVLPSELAGLICRGDRRDLLPLCWPFQLVSVIRNVNFGSLCAAKTVEKNQRKPRAATLPFPLSLCEHSTCVSAEYATLTSSSTKHLPIVAGLICVTIRA